MPELGQVILCDARRTPLSTHPEELAAGFSWFLPWRGPQRLVALAHLFRSPHVPTVRLEPRRISQAAGRVVTLIKVACETDLLNPA